MSQHELIIQYIRENGYIIPAKMDGKRAFRGEYIGSQADKRCREMRRPIQGKWQNPFGRQMLDSVKEGKFEKFFLLDREKVKPIPDRVIKWQAQFKTEAKEQNKQLTMKI